MNFLFDHSFQNKPSNRKDIPVCVSGHLVITEAERMYNVKK